MRLRIWSAKCGVDAPMSWRTSSRVTSWPALRRMGCSASDIDSLGGLRPLFRAADLADLEEQVDPRLHAHRDRLVVPDDPAVIVDAAHRIPAVARLDVEEVRVDRRVEAVGVRDDEQRPVRPARRQRRGGPGVERAVRAGGPPGGGSARANPMPCPGPTPPQPKEPSMERAKSMLERTASPLPTRVTVPSL